ncbi:MAG TPA: tRNA (adenosine(37)-N6)-threonylcarbamoyltransferase complex ATPase subunit type 1 TsaE [Candidatus Paceibacterota bacterium]|nr:tRNA (adenosine(37)-N6)-threonylcarbamoyltransferase complex ATPase subunit type 1 TsaE [Candidatus Paceibacterota bacterium]
MQIVSDSPVQTQTLAANMAAKVRKESNAKATVIALEGELGAGKTTFIQGFARALGVDEKVKSPTFLLIKEFELDKGKLYHIDCYRINDPHELILLGIEKILSTPGNIILIEWSERIVPLLPQDRITIHINHTGETSRLITINP